MRYTLALATIGLLLLNSCGRDEGPEEIPTPNYSEQDIERVTGFDMYSSQGTLLSIFGNPNERRGMDIAYPVPADTAFLLVGDDDITNFWIVAAEPLVEDQTAPFDSLYADGIYTEAGVNASAFLGAALNDPSVNVQIDCSGWINGYYRIFYKRTDGEIFSQNLHIQHGEIDFQSYITTMTAFWE